VAAAAAATPTTAAAAAATAGDSTVVKVAAAAVVAAAISRPVCSARSVRRRVTAPSGATSGSTPTSLPRHIRVLPRPPPPPTELTPIGMLILAPLTM
jgi:hypothetical protein